MLLNACKDIGSAVNIGKTKYMEIGRHRGMAANEHIRIGSNSYEKVKTFKYLGSLCRHSIYWTRACTWPTVQRGQASNRGLDGEETHRVLEVRQRLQALQGPHGRASTRQSY